MALQKQKIVTRKTTTHMINYERAIEGQQNI